MNKRYIAFGIKNIEEINITNIECGIGLKPEGGLCIYDVNKDGIYMSPFERWCEEETINRGMLRYGVVCEVSDEAHIYQINSWADIHRLIRNFILIKTVPGASNQYIADIGIDYQKVAQKYDGIRFTGKAIANTELSEKHNVDIIAEKLLKGEQKNYEVKGFYEINTSGWECPCIYIFNPGILKNVHVIENTREYKLDDNEVFDEIAKELDEGKVEDEIIKSLYKYYSGNNSFKDFINIVKNAKKNENRFENLAIRVKDLIEVQRKEDIPLLEDEIKNALEKLYEISKKTKSFDEFSKRFTDRKMLSTSEKPKGKTQSIYDMFDEMFNN